MKKRIFVILLACVILLASATAVVFLKDRTPYREVNTNPELTLYQSWPLAPTEYTFVNSGPYSYALDTWFCVEVWRLGAWRTIPCDGVATMDVAMTVPPYGEKTIVPHLESVYGDLPAGKYRLVQKVRGGPWDTLYVTAEFEVEK